MRDPAGALGEGFGVGFRWVVGGALFLWKNKGKGEGGGEGGGGLGTGKETTKSMRTLCRNYPLANYPYLRARALYGKS